MRINHNISAVITNKQLMGTENALTKSMERLSSGLKINRAEDNPSGIAISNKMQAQIDGLDQASQNASDGMSVLETADGALGEMTNILQRLRELAVQAANDTNSDEDREKIQEEMDTLSKEVDRISGSTEFNTKSLLDGSSDKHVYGDNFSRVYVSEDVVAGMYELEINAPAIPAEITSGANVDDAFAISDAEAGSLKINGAIVTLKEGMQGVEVYEAIRKGAERGGVIISDYAMPPLTFTSKDFGSDATVALEFSNPALAAKFGLGEQVAEQGENAEVKLKAGSMFDNHQQATINYDGNKYTITDIDGFEMSFMADAGFVGDIALEVTDVGPMDIQVGANANQMITIRIPPVGLEDLYLDNLNVRTFEGAGKAIAKLDDAIGKINTVRSTIGAVTNRLEYSVSNLDQTSENMNAAISRILDVDMAEEMTEYTKYNVLTQAATSALAQANEIPQMALQLLQ